MRLEYFEMIDSVDELDLDQGTIVTTSRLPKDSPVFDGHFPGFQMLPGVMMLEIMNHAAGFLLYWRARREKFVFLGSVKRAKFRRFIEPGTLVKAEAKIIHDGSGFCVAEARLMVDDELAADAEIVLIDTAFPNEEVRAAMESRSVAMLAASGA